MMTCHETASILDVVLAALYLPGGPRAGKPPRSSWPAVLSVLRRAAPTLGEVQTVLRRHGFWSEAVVLDTPRLVAWAEEQCARGRVLSAASASYPGRWLEVLGPSAPPAVWRKGAIPVGPFLAIVGSRLLDAADQRFARHVGAEAVRLGYRVVSGGAVGADRAAIRGARSEAALAGVGPRTLVILPYGLRHGRLPDVPCLSVAPPDEPFQGARAMERNLLVHALADASVVVRARFREGGTWHGSVGALRQVGARLIVQDSRPCPAARALIGLGAEPITRPEALAAALAARRSGPQLTLAG